MLRVYVMITPRRPLFVLEPGPDVRPARLDQRVQLRHKGDEPHQVAADEGDDERRAPGPVVVVTSAPCSFA